MLFDEYNEKFFKGKLMPITLLIQKSQSLDGTYNYSTHKRKKDCSGWLPLRERLDHAYIIISEGCWKEDSVEGTLLHEMCHQYQCEVLDIRANHDAIFCSMARRIERLTGHELL